jgi:serine/threonine protein kinase
VAAHDRGFITAISSPRTSSSRRIGGWADRSDLAQPIASDARPAGAGTRGYTSAGACAGATAIPSDDIYAIGAVLYLLATGAEPSRAPDAEHLFLRAPALLNLAVSAPLLRVVARCLADDPAHAFTSTRELRGALLACLAEADDATVENADVRHPATAERGPLTKPRRMSDRDPLDAPTPSAIAPETLLRHARRAADRPPCAQGRGSGGEAP